MKKIISIIGSLGILAFGACAFCSSAFASNSVVLNYNAVASASAGFTKYTGSSYPFAHNSTVFLTCGSFDGLSIADTGIALIPVGPPTYDPNIFSLVSLGNGHYRYTSQFDSQYGDSAPLGIALSQVSDLADVCGGSIFLSDTNPVPPMITSAAWSLPTGTASKMTNVVSQQLGDKGTLEILAIAIGIPLAFYIVQQLMALPPKPNKRKSRKK